MNLLPLSAAGWRPAASSPRLNKRLAFRRVLSPTSSSVPLKLLQWIKALGATVPSLYGSVRFTTRGNIGPVPLAGSTAIFTNGEPNPAFAYGLCEGFSATHGAVSNG